MASFEKRGNKWRAEVQNKGERERATFATYDEARIWATKREAELNDPDRIASTHTVADLLTKYGEEVSPKKASGHKEVERFAFFLKNWPEIGALKLSEVTPKHFGDWRDERLKVVTGATVDRDLNMFSAAFHHARKEWKWIKESPISNVARPKDSEARTRRVEEEEIERLGDAMGYVPDTLPKLDRQTAYAVFLFAIETGMRQAEICRMTWEDINFEGAFVVLPKTKNGSSRRVPLSKKALSLIAQMEPARGKLFTTFKETDSNGKRVNVTYCTVFGIHPNRIGQVMRETCARIGIENLHFHDTRREALTRLSDVFHVMDLAKISGHKDVRILQEVYYAPKVEDLAARLHKAEEAKQQPTEEPKETVVEEKPKTKKPRTPKARGLKAAA